MQGVTIELTKDQIALIEKEKARRLRECKSFERILKHFGFVKVDGGFHHTQHGWYAEILDRRYYQDCLLVGKGLKGPGFPGGHVYGSPEAVAEALTAALDEIRGES